jgi:hypothetical protein
MTDHQVERKLQDVTEKARPVVGKFPAVMRLNDYNGSPDRFEHILASSYLVRNKKVNWSKAREAVFKVFGAALIDAGWTALYRPALLKGAWGILRGDMTESMQDAWTPTQQPRIQLPGYTGQPEKYWWTDSLGPEETPDIAHEPAVAPDPEPVSPMKDDGSEDEKKTKEPPSAASALGSKIAGLIHGFEYGDKHMKRLASSFVCSVSSSYDTFKYKWI